VTWITVHFAAGMVASLVIGAVLAVVRRRWLLYFPLIMTACGVFAVAPVAVAWLRGGALDSPLLNAFFLYPILRRQAWLRTPEAAHAAFQIVVILYSLVTCAFVAYIRRGMWRVPYVMDALELLRERAGRQRLLPALAVLVPLLLLGGMAAWVVRQQRPAESRDAAAVADATSGWAQMVHRRMGVGHAESLGLIQAAPWNDGQWLTGEVIRTPRRWDEFAAATLAEHAQRAGLDFLVLALPASASDLERAVAFEIARELRMDLEELTLLHGVYWSAPAPDAGSDQPRAVLVLPLDATEPFEGTASEPSVDFPADLMRLAVAGQRAADMWPAAFVQPGIAEDVYAASGAREVCVGLMGLASADHAVSESPWDSMLSRGGRLWGGFATADVPSADAAPDEAARPRLHVSCPGRGPADVVAGLRAGRWWTEQGGIARELELEVSAPHLPRPALMGETLIAPPDAEIAVMLRLDVSPEDASGKALDAVDSVELVANAQGRPQVMETFRGVRGRRYLRHAFRAPPDANGGLGVYIRARGRQQGPGGVRWIVTNPVRLLVRDLPPPPPRQEPTLVAQARPAQKGRPSAKRPKTAAELERERRQGLSVIGLPSDVPVLAIETFRKEPGDAWSGRWSEYAERRGPAIADRDLQIRFQQRTQAAEDARLLFRCHTIDCLHLELRLHTSLSREPYRLTRAVPDRTWTELDLSLAEDFFAPEGAPERIAAPAEIQAIEWRAVPLSGSARFHVTDFVLYRPTLSRRRDVFRKRLEELALDVRKLFQDPSANKRWHRRLEAITAHVDQLRKKTAPLAKLPEEGDMALYERQLDELAGRAERLRLERLMSRAFLQHPPQFVVGLESPARRVSVAQPAYAFQGRVVPQVDLHAGAGDAESIQLVVIPLWDRLEDVRITCSPFAPAGNPDAARPPFVLPSSAVDVHLVQEVETPRRPDIPANRTGRVPDELVPYAPFSASPGELQAVLITVHTPRDLPPGTYRGTVAIQPQGVEPTEVNLLLNRWDFDLGTAQFPVLAPVEEQDEQAARRSLHEQLLRHRVAPFLDRATQQTDEAHLEDVRFCTERGLPLAVLLQARGPIPTARSPALARAGRLAAKLWQETGRPMGAALVPFDVPQGTRSRAVTALNAIAERFPRLVLLLTGQGDPPLRLRADYWARPIVSAGQYPPHTEEVEVRRARTAQREAWQIRTDDPDYPLANATLVNRLVDTRLLPWFAWRYGVRALLLPAANRAEARATGDGSLVYPDESDGWNGSLRLVALRDGVEDYEMLLALWNRARQLRERQPDEAFALLASVETLEKNIARKIGRLRNPRGDIPGLDAARMRLGRTLERLNATWWDAVDREVAGDLPAPPFDLEATGGNGQVTLTWTRSPSSGVTAYHVYRSTVEDRGYSRVNTAPVRAARFTDHDVKNGRSYYYFVRSARDPRFQGPRSRRVNAVPSPRRKEAPAPAETDSPGE
jgi:hypothetical protein